MLAHHNSDGIRTSLRSRIHSLPPSHRSPHLERHQLTQERARLQQEIARLELRRSQCRQRVAEIDTQLAREPAEACPPSRAAGLRTDDASEQAKTPVDDACDRHRFSRMAINY